MKLAEGCFDTHSHKITFNKEFLKQMALESGCSEKSIDGLDRLNFARELPQVILTSDHEKFFSRLVRLCHFHCNKKFFNSLHVYLISDEGKILADLES